ncbi:hypothetical protein SAMD00019534_022360, partial [Acytostelium subglobosum LB1]|uniref:hypothetical protein n=1 Tax=Acytostelium subglobosum LB1 TaxID=1410327 RepID=UPI000644987C
MSTPVSLTQNITADGIYKPEANRYHLYINKGCPFAHRALIALYIKGLEHAIHVSFTHPAMTTNGWVFDANYPGSTADQAQGFPGVRELYLTTDPTYQGKYTVPVLWDTQTKTIVNNESAQILRIFNSELNNLAKHPEIDLYPEAQRKDIDAFFEWANPAIISGVYGPGYAKSQEDYDAKFDKFYQSLDELNNRLAAHRYAVGSTLTEMDVKLFVTLIRFEPAYSLAYKLNLKSIREYPNIREYIKDLYQIPDIKRSVEFDHIKKIYFVSPTTPEPIIVPRGPALQWLDEPSTRAKM